jgi:hypothetical protein
MMDWFGRRTVSVKVMVLFYFKRVDVFIVVLSV